MPKWLLVALKGSSDKHNFTFGDFRDNARYTQISYKFWRDRWRSLAQNP
jgi:hypothetical protein